MTDPFFGFGGSIRRHYLQIRAALLLELIRRCPGRDSFAEADVLAWIRQSTYRQFVSST